MFATLIFFGSIPWIDIVVGDVGCAWIYGSWWSFKLACCDVYSVLGFVSNCHTGTFPETHQGSFRLVKYHHSSRQHFGGPNNDSTKWFQVIFWSSISIWNDPMNTCFANTSDFFFLGGCEPIPTHAIASTKEPCFWHVCLQPSELPSDVLENNGLRSRMLSSVCFDHIFYVQLLGLVSRKCGRWVRGRCPLRRKQRGWR